MKWYHTILDIFIIACGFMYLAIPFTKAERTRGTWRHRFYFGMGLLFILNGSGSLLQHSGWWARFPGAEVYLDRARAVLACVVIVLAVKHLLSVQWKGSMPESGSNPSSLQPIAPGMKVCAYCGRENVEAAMYCSECGTDKFKEDIAPAPASRTKSALAT